MTQETVAAKYGDHNSALNTSDWERLLSHEGEFIVESRDRLLPDNRIDLVGEVQDWGPVQFLEGRHQVRSLLVKQVVRLVQLIHPHSPCKSIQCQFDHLDMSAPTI